MNQPHGGLRIRSTLVILAGSLFAGSMARGQTELITNGGFETGDLSGWSVETLGGLQQGQWRINNGAFVPPGPVPQPIAPLAGAYDALCWQIGPGPKRLTSAPLLVPADVPVAALSWLDAVRNYDFMGRYADPNQEFRVQLLDAGLVPIAQIYSTNPGDSVFQPGPNVRQFDVTTLLQSLAGQTVYLRFEVQDDFFFFNVNVDNVSLLIGTGGDGGGGDGGGGDGGGGDGGGGDDGGGDDGGGDDGGGDDGDGDGDGGDGGDDDGPMLIDVFVDIHPGSDENPVNLKVNSKTKGKAAAAGGVLPVAILGSPDYDAAQIEAETLLLGDPLLTGAALPIKWHVEDVNLDGLDDLVLHFSVLELVDLGAINQASTGLIVVGETLEGDLITGSDSVSIVPAANDKKNNKQSTAPANNKKSR